MLTKAVTYLRSSKDRSDVSIAAQRRQLAELAATRGMTIIGEYVDVVASAKNEDRPGLRQLMLDLRGHREWHTILTLNTSRLSRRQWFAFVFRRECERAKVSLVFAQVPDMDPVSSLIMHSVLTAMDEIHSLKSRQDGLAGMRENVRKGFRAGGKAPLGYRLEHTATDTMRDGKPVMKSKLTPSEDLSLVGKYLRARAQGRPRTAAARDLKLKWPATTLISLEWNALVYAGHTVWNRHAPNGSGTKYRPKAEWEIERHTHPAIISDEEAGAILKERETVSLSLATSRGRAAASKYLLTGLLCAPDGKAWEGDGRYYRYRAKFSRRVYRAELDDIVMAHIEASMQRCEFLEALAREARKAASPAEEIKRLRREAVQTKGQVDRAMQLAVELESPAPALRKVDELERRRTEIVQRIGQLEADAEERAGLVNVTAEDIARMVANIDDPGAMLRAAIERIELDPVSLECRIHYRLDLASGATLASPGGVEPPLPP